jgi:hypothetical protein
MPLIRRYWEPVAPGIVRKVERWLELLDRDFTKAWELTKRAISKIELKDAKKPGIKVAKGGDKWFLWVSISIVTDCVCGFVGACRYNRKGKIENTTGTHRKKHIEMTRRPWCCYLYPGIYNTSIAATFLTI